MAFWTEDFTSLVRTLEFIPRKDMSRAELFNTYTRLILIASLIALIAGIKQWYLILIIGITAVIIMYYMMKEEKKTGSSGPNNEGEYQPMGLSIYTSTPRKNCPYPTPYHEPTQITTVPDLKWKPMSILKPYPVQYMADYKQYNNPEPARMVPYPPMSAWETYNAPDAKPIHNYYNHYPALNNCGNQDKEIERVATTAFNIYSDRMRQDSTVRDYAEMQKNTFFGSLLGKTPSCY